MTAELMGGLLLNSPEYDYPRDPSWICQMINDDPTEGQKYIDGQIKNLGTYAAKMQFLFSLKVCFEYTMKDLENGLADEFYPISCCSGDRVEDAQRTIGRYKSAALKVDTVICYEMDCNKIPCESQTSTKHSNLTPHQWTLAFHIFFKALGFDTSKGGPINQVFLARFLHLVTDEDCPETFANSKYLGYLKNAPDFNRTKPTQTIQDLEAVRVHFERTGFAEALPIIDTMLKACRWRSKTH